MFFPKNNTYLKIQTSKISTILKIFCLFRLDLLIENIILRQTSHEYIKHNRHYKEYLFLNRQIPINVGINTEVDPDGNLKVLMTCLMKLVCNRILPFLA